ncbi:MAG TPA: hypothetical protein DCX54_07805, partial [Flavobacteriales bacterium]|nr:hypothetical protein [Flavobacteriales bacterium]
TGEKGMNQLLLIYKAIDNATDGDGVIDLSGCTLDFKMTPEDYRGKNDGTIRKALHDYLNQ